jgi:hypothetical protein
MTKLKTFAVTALAAASIGAGGLVAAPTASAMPRYTCAEAEALASVYWNHSQAFYQAGNMQWAGWYAGRAAQIVADYC